MKLRFHRLWLALGGVWIALVVILSLMPAPPDPLAFEQRDKLSHFFAYAWLMLWFGQLYTVSPQRWKFALVFVALGIGVEFLQRLTPDRQFEVADMAANTGGVLIGWLLATTPLAQSLSAFETRYLRRK